MNINQNEQDFVFRYFQSGKLNTWVALQKVKAKVRNSANEEVAKVRYVRMSYFRRIAIAASILVLLAVGAYTLLRPKTITLAANAEAIAYHLPDGTQVTLSPHSTLSYQENQCRDVELEGCAFFQVKHDEEHPFDVRGERGHVRVLGTQFQVDERTDTPVVMVTSGKVFFSSKDTGKGILLTKGQQARLLMGADKPEMQGICRVNDVAWATHQLHFDNTPLAEVLQELSRYANGKALTASAANKRLTGDFSTDSIQQAIQIIEQTLDVKISVREIHNMRK